MNIPATTAEPFELVNLKQSSTFQRGMEQQKEPLENGEIEKIQTARARIPSCTLALQHMIQFKADVQLVNNGLLARIGRVFTGKATPTAADYGEVPELLNSLERESAKLRDQLPKFIYESFSPLFEGLHEKIKTMLPFTIEKEKDFSQLISDYLQLLTNIQIAFQQNYEETLKEQQKQIELFEKERITFHGSYTAEEQKKLKEKISALTEELRKEKRHSNQLEGALKRNEAELNSAKFIQANTANELAKAKEDLHHAIKISEGLKLEVLHLKGRIVEMMKEREETSLKLASERIKTELLTKQAAQDKIQTDELLKKLGERITQFEITLSTQKKRSEG